MASGLKEGDNVWVPCRRIPALENRGVAMYQSKIVQINGRRARIDLPRGKTSDWIGTSLLHQDIGILIINIGDLQSEHTLLDPLAKSVTQFLHLIAPAGEVRSIRVRSLAELKVLWLNEQAAYTHVVWIGHGSPDGLRFAVDGLVGAKQLVETLHIRGAPTKVYLSLCCQTGRKPFANVVSKSSICADFVAPFHSVPGAVASQFCQTFLVSHFLEGKTTRVAFKVARNSVPGAPRFRHWKAGSLRKR